MIFQVTGNEFGSEAWFASGQHERSARGDNILEEWLAREKFWSLKAAIFLETFSNKKKKPWNSVEKYF